MSLKKFYVGVKALIHDDRGYLILKHAKGHWDVPGGRMDDSEDFKDTLAREISEELPGAELVGVGKLSGAFRLPKDIDEDISLVLVYYQVTASLPEEIKYSEEHTEHKWVLTPEDVPESANPEMARILRELLKA